VAIALLVIGTLVTGGWRVWSAEGDLADAAVLVAGARQATVTNPGGAPRPAVDGESLAKGAVVTTGAAGAVTLDVRGRQIRLAPSTTVVVPDGAVAELRRGTVLVDRRRGPSVSVRIGDVTLDQVATGVLRADRGFSVRVVVYSGGARARTTDRRLDVPRLHQMAVAGQALPDRAQPLQLTGDDWEREVIPDVSAADAVLSRLARGIDADARLGAPARLAVLPAVYRAAVAGLPPDAGRSEALLPVAIGLAAQDGPSDTAVARADRLRRDGGSWGVVAGLMSSRTADVSRRLADLLSQGSSTVAIGGPAGALGGSGEPRPASSASPGPSASPRPSPRPSAGATSAPSPSPTPTPSSTVDQVVDTIRRLLPTPAATLVPTSAPAPSAGAALPTPTPLVISGVAPIPVRVLLSWSPW